jgi:hypothetical protein
MSEMARTTGQLGFVKHKMIKTQLHLQKQKSGGTSNSVSLSNNSRKLRLPHSDERQASEKSNSQEKKKVFQDTSNQI